MPDYLPSYGFRQRQLMEGITGSLPDMIVFEPGAELPTRTLLQRSIGYRQNGPSGTMVPAIDEDGWLVNTDQADGRGGTYFTVDTVEPCVYQKAEFIFFSTGVHVPDQAAATFVAWTEDITKGSYSTKPTAFHLTLFAASWAVWKIETVGGAVTIIASGAYPQGSLSLDESHTLESAIDLDAGKLYMLVDGLPLATVEEPLLKTLTGRFPGPEIFKQNADDNEPGIRNWECSPSTAKGREVRDRYLRTVAALAGARPSDEFTTVDEFMGGNQASGSIGDTGWSSGGSGVAIAAAAGVLDHPGVVNFSTGTTNGTVYHLYKSGGANVASLSMLDFKEGGFVLAERVAGITDRTFRVGFTSDASSATPNHGFYLEALTTDTNIFLVGRLSGNQTRIDTGIAKGTVDYLTLRFYAITAIKFGCAISVNGGPEITTGAGDVPLVLDDAAGDEVPYNQQLLPFVQQIITGGASRGLNIDRFWLTIEATSR